MEINHKKIIQIASYAAAYKGNFVRSLEALEESLRKVDSQIIYIFQESTAKQPWYADFAKQHKSYTIPDNGRDAFDVLFDIVSKEQPDLIHTHHDGYDQVVAKVCQKYKKQTGSSIVQVWHLRNVKGLSQKGWHKLYWGIKFFIHYGWYGRFANIISVNDYMLNFACKYKRINILHEDHTRKISLPNGIALSRIETREIPSAPHDPFTFFSFGGRNVQKRVEVLFQAASLLASKGIKFKILITKGVETVQVANDFFNGNIPTWCQLAEQDDNVNNLFEQADCFISTAIHETFCNAICEASVFGLPIIQSDIDGTMWNASNPSVFLYPTLNAEALASRMETIMNANRADLIEKCLITRQNNTQNYSFDKWCEKVITFYQEL